MYQFRQLIHRTEPMADCVAPLLAGNSAVAQSLQQLVAVAAGSMDAVLIKGPAGAGKFALTQAIHAASPQRYGSLIKASGASFDIDYLKARWEGTLYLRHVMLLPVPLQHKLLMWLDSEQAHYVRLIATSDAQDDSDRVIAPLRTRLERLYIPCPPLSHRRDDISDMVKQLWEDDSDHLPPILSEQAWSDVSRHNWPEHFRSLSAFAAKASRLYGGKAVSAEQLAQLLDDRPTPFSQHMPFDLKQHLAQEEKRFLVEALLQSNGVIAAAAAKSGLKRTTFLAKMKRYGLARI